MGTLFKQEPRPFYAVGMDDIDDQIKLMGALSKAHKIPLDKVISIAHVLELRRANDLYAYNGDAFDEQMQGFGELLRELMYNMSKTNDAFDEQMQEFGELLQELMCIMSKTNDK